MKKIIIMFIVLIFTINTYSQTNQNMQITYDQVTQLHNFYKNMVLYKSINKSNKSLIYYNMVNFYYNMDLYKNYMKLPYNKFTYKRYGWDYYNGKPEWIYLGKYPKFSIPIK